MTADQVVFWVFAPISIGAAIAMLVQRKAVHSALFLIVNFFAIAVMYLVLGSPFLFVVQIAVYAGAIMVLFLFVIMLLGVDREESLIERLRGQRPLAIALSIGVALEVFFAVRLGIGLHTDAPAVFSAAKNGNPKALAGVLFTGYFLPFEITSILLIIAAIAALVMTKRQVTVVRTDAGRERRESQESQEGTPEA